MKYNTDMKFVEISDREAWDAYVRRHEYGHPLQLWGWGEAKKENNWQPRRLALMNGEEWAAGAQVLMWPILRTGKFLAYVPRGPVVDPTSPAMARLLTELVAWARQNKVLYIRLEPAWTKARLPRGWRPARHNIQMAQTYMIDLKTDEGILLERMARKHRQYIRKSERDGVEVTRELGGDLAPMYDLYTETARRAGFGIHAAEYYETLMTEMGKQNHLYYARMKGRPVAFLWLAAAGKVAYELYGGVNPEGQELKANYYLKWHAMTELKAAGYAIYDFNGRLNEGVSQFKAGFGPDETDYIGTWDYPLNNLGYDLWERLWPAAIAVRRRLASVRGR